MTRKKTISLKRNYAEVPKHDLNITVIGEMNANVGHFHSGSKNLWENRQEKKNGNAENLVDSLIDYSLTEGGPRFQYGDIHTHIDTERQSKNEIDHILI